MKKLLVLCFLLLGASAKADEWNPNKRVTMNFISASRGGYVFRGTDTTKIGNVGLVAGKTYGSSGKSHALRPYGFEGEARFPVLEQSCHISTTLRIVPMGLKLSPTNVEQSGGDGFLSAAYGFLPVFSADYRLGFDLGVRARRWQLVPGAFPNTAHVGFIVAARYESPKWNALFETGLMAIGLGTPSSLGIQRDASSLRIRIGHNISPTITPWLEFFHTHRDFYGATIIAGESALFIDEASLLLGVGVVL